MSEVQSKRLQYIESRLIMDNNRDLNKFDPIIDYAQEPLVSLVDACIPLVGIVENIQTYVSTALQTTPAKPADELTRDESASIRLYTMEWSEGEVSLYYILNRILEIADRKNLQPRFRYLKLFLTALVKLPVAPPQTVWRGVRQIITSNCEPGTELIWWAFSSCTTRLTVLENDLYLDQNGTRTLFSIEVFTARNISTHSDFADEYEIIMLPGTYLIVQSQFCPMSDLYIVHLKQKMSKETLLEPPFTDACLYPKSDQPSSDLVEASFSMEPTVSPVVVPWYRKKWILISIICFLITVCLLSIILGSVFGIRSSRNSSRSELSCQLTFVLMVSYSTGRMPPDSIAVGDFNNGSHVDIAVALYRGGSVGVFLGYGNGTFAAQENFPAGSNPWSVIVADFDNDRRPDIAVTNGAEHNVGVLFGYGNGTFAAQTIHPAGIDPWSVAAGGFNNDYQMDVVVADHASDNISIILGYANGSLVTETTLPAGNEPYSVAVGDFNNDDRLDIAVVNFADHNVGILLDYGNGSFTTQMTFPTGNKPNWTAVGDVNNDSRLDIAVTNGLDDNVSVLLEYGNETFASHMTFSTDNNPQSVSFSDLNKDSRFDIAVANHGSNSVAVLLNTGHCCISNEL